MVDSSHRNTKACAAKSEYEARRVRHCRRKKEYSCAAFTQIGRWFDLSKLRCCAEPPQNPQTSTRITNAIPPRTFGSRYDDDLPVPTKDDGRQSERHTLPGSQHSSNSNNQARGKPVFSMFILPSTTMRSTDLSVYVSADPARGRHIVELSEIRRSGQVIPKGDILGSGHPPAS